MYLVAFSLERLDTLAPDEPGRACYQNLHRITRNFGIATTNFAPHSFT